ncbi:MAG: hypothetical protein EOO01_41725 [Chitinophagaceae bacterium]|nr:MAG: hypothetical protein EOO01_41725 [Chitinophagaceae bacterium]
MKKLTVLSAILLTSVMVNAQDNTYAQMHMELARASMILIFAFLISSFILALVKQLLDSRLKHKMVEKGVSDEVVAQFLRPVTKQTKTYVMKWFLIFLSIGIGFSLINVTQPLGIHSLAILAFCIAFGFLAFYFFVRKSDHQ